MPVDGGSIYSEVRVKLDALNADIAKAKAAFDKLGAEWAEQAERYSSVIGKKYKTALEAIAKESKNISEVQKSGALTELQATTRLIELRREELKLMQDRAVKEGQASANTVAAIKETTMALEKLEAKEKLLTEGTGKKGLGQTFADLRDVMMGPVAAVKEVIQAFVALKAWMDKMEQEWAKQAEAIAKVDIILKDTGANAWITSAALQDMANQLQSTTKFSDDMILSMEGVLLGFRNIQGANFDAAVKAILDMSTVMGMDLTSAAQAVGKALDNPIEGLDSLSRQGFKFTEQEKNMIKQLVSAGKLFDAQKVILDEINKAYGGTAEAVASLDVNLKERLKNAIGDVNEEIGRSISRFLAPFRQAFINLNNEVSANMKLMNDYREVMEKEKRGEALTVQEKIVKAQVTLNELLKQQAALTSQGVVSSFLNADIEAMRLAIGVLKEQEAQQKKTMDARAKAAADAALKEKQLADAAEWQASISAKRVAIQTEYANAVKEADRQVAAGMITEQEASEQKQSALKAEIDALVNLIQTEKLTTGATTELLAAETARYSANKTALEKMADAEKALQDAEEERKKALEEQRKEFDKLGATIEQQVDKAKTARKDEVQNIRDTREELIKQLDMYDALGYNVDELREMVIKLYDELEKDAATKKFVKNFETIADAVASVFASVTSIVEGMLSEQLNALENNYAKQRELIENNGKTKEQSLEDQLKAAKEAGDEELVNETEKQIKLLKLNKEYEAERRKLEYKSAMAQWTSTLLNATAQAASNVIKAWTDPLTGPIIASVVTAVNAANLAAIMASKPKPPAAATGGIVLPQAGGSLVRVAENKSAELLLNDSDRGADTLNAFAERIAAAMGSEQNIVVPLSLDGQVVAEAVVRRINNGNVRLTR